MRIATVVLISFLLLLPGSALALCSSAGVIELPNPDRNELGTDAQQNVQQDDVPTFKVEVKLVNVFATVVDQNGAPVTGLKREDFRLFENGELQKISVFGRESQLPLSIVLAIDTSLSTRRNLQFELESARRFANSIMRPVDRLALYRFSETVHEVVPFTADMKVLDRAIRNIRPGSATALYDAVYLASGSLQDRQGRKVIVVITDGGDTVSSTTYHDAVRAAQQAEAIVYSIIIVPVQASAGRDTGGEHALIQLSHDTGGKHYYAASEQNLDKAFEQVSEELRTQYLLAYYPSQRVTDSDFRRIEIQVQDADKAGLQARYRTGYYTSKPR